MPFINEVVSQNKNQLEASKIAHLNPSLVFIRSDQVSAVLKSRIVGQASMQKAMPTSFT